jgi:hypothetical protein
MFHFAEKGKAKTFPKMGASPQLVANKVNIYQYFHQFSKGGPMGSSAGWAKVSQSAPVSYFLFHY